MEDLRCGAGLSVNVLLHLLLGDPSRLLLQWSRNLLSIKPISHLFLRLDVLLDTCKLFLESTQKLRVTIVEELAILILLVLIYLDLVLIYTDTLLSSHFSE